MLTRSDQTSRYDTVWRAAEPYLRARKNDIHIPISFAFARRLLREYAEADEDIVSLAILLHDVGWWAIDMAEILDKGFGPNMMQSEVRFRHEREGVRLSREVLAETGWEEEAITAVAAIIDGHDTRPEPRSLDDRIVRDADKLWRFTVPGVAIACDWNRLNPHQYADQLERLVPRLETEAGRSIAAEELATTRVALMLHLI
jgi:hypothetical protein